MIATVDLSSKTRLTYHAVPNWHGGEGWKGDVLVCNKHVYATTGAVFGNNHGRELPEEVVSPCGFRVYLRRPMDSPPFANIETINHASMRPVGTTLFRRDHADKIATPCKRCYPKEEG